jgi:mycofactocin glycosyltransferase
VRIAALGTLRSGRTIADALMRAYWPLTLATALAVPRTRPALLAAALTKGDLAYGTGLWMGCAQHRTLDPLLPGLGWRMTSLTADELTRRVVPCLPS